MRREKLLNEQIKCKNQAFEEGIDPKASEGVDMAILEGSTVKKERFRTAAGFGFEEEPFVYKTILGSPAMDTLDETLSCLINNIPHPPSTSNIGRARPYLSAPSSRSHDLLHQQRAFLSLVSSKNDLNQWNVVDGSPLTKPIQWIPSCFRIVLNSPNTTVTVVCTLFTAVYRNRAMTSA